MARKTARQKVQTIATTVAFIVPALLGIWLFVATDTVGGPSGVTSRAEARPLDAPILVVPLLSSFPDPTVTATQPPALLTGIPFFVPVEATIEPSAGETTDVNIPGSHGKVRVPNGAGGSAPLRVVVRPASAPTVPSSLLLLGAIEISFTNLNDSSSVKELSQDVIIEMSYAGRGLSAAELDRLVIYNASRQEFLPTTLDTARQMAIARTRRFSSFWLVGGAKSFVPVVTREFGGGW